MLSNNKQVYNWDTKENMPTIEFVSDDFNDVSKHASYITVMDRTEGVFELGHRDYEYVAREVARLTATRPDHEFRYAWDYRPESCTPPANR